MQGSRAKHLASNRKVDYGLFTMKNTTAAAAVTTPTTTANHALLNETMIGIRGKLMEDLSVFERAVYRVASAGSRTEALDAIRESIRTQHFRVESEARCVRELRALKMRDAMRVAQEDEREARATLRELTEALAVFVGGAS